MHEFDIYKIRNELIGIYSESGWIYWIADLKRPNERCKCVCVTPNEKIHHVVQKYFNRLLNRYIIVGENDLVWICRKELYVEDVIM